MVNITLATGTDRKSVIVDSATTLGEVLRSNDVNTDGATIMLKGQVCTLSDQSHKLSELGVTDGESCVLNVTVKAAAAAAVAVEFNTVGTAPVLTVVTNITKEQVESGYTSLKAVDEKGNQKFSVSAGTHPELTAFSFVGDGYVDDKLAASFVMPVGSTKDDAMKKYGNLLVKAEEHIANIEAKATEAKAAIAEIFETTEE